MTYLKIWDNQSLYSKHSQIRLGMCNIIGIILALCVITGCASTEKRGGLQLPPITDNPTHVNYHGKFVWNDLLCDDAVAAKQFYGQLFGWTFESSGSYTMVKNNGQSIAGIAQLGKDYKATGASRWICALSVDHVDDSASLVVEQGGQILIAPIDTSHRGRQTLVRDPQGAQLVLLHSPVGDPKDSEPVIGSWLWHELWSNDAEKSLDFYQKLAGYEYDGKTNDYLILHKDGQFRAGIRSVPESKLEVRWVPAVRVLDTKAIAARAEKLGGKLLIGPRPTPDNGSVALISDPSGALIIIQRWDAGNIEQEK